MKLAPVPGWALDDPRGVRRPLDPRLPPLLRAIAARGTLLAACREVGLPYRTAWALLEEAAERIGAALVESTRGRGATLTPLARRWLALDDEAAAALAALTPLPLGDAAGRRALRVAASHDLALAQLRDRWRLAHGVAIEFHGSLESLAALASRQADVAGFHVVADAPGDDPALAMLRDDRDVLIRFLRREQGLIVPRGNPRKLRSLADVAARRLSIVNRQPGSGTRLLVDRMLADLGVDSGSLRGYGDEEFTHAAVAATVAAGRADAGVGVRAAAAQFGLGFVALVDEHYLFACRRASLDAAGVTVFRGLLDDAATRAVVAPLPGYALDRPGRLVEPKGPGVDGWRRALRARR